jgi:hypothetical protein
MRGQYPLIVMAILIVILTGCSAFIEPITPVPSTTPFQFITATTRPTASPTIMIPTPPASSTAKPPTPVPSATIDETALAAVSRTPVRLRSTQTTTPTRSPEDPCPRQPQGVFGEIFAADIGLKPAMGCPISPPDSKGEPHLWLVTVKYQTFERGTMIWLSNVGWYEASVIYVLLDDTSYARYDDTFDPGLESTIDAFNPPEGMFVPLDALGKVWREQLDVRNSLGFATAPVLEMATQMQMLERGEMVYLPLLASVLAFKRGIPTNIWATFDVVVQP